MEQAAWIRVKYTLTVYDVNGEEMEIPAEELAKVILIDPDTANWTQKDGWWYCKDAAGTGEATKPLFREVAFSGPNMDNRYQGCTLYIQVNAQAVQKANNKETVLEAAGWPPEPEA